MNQKQFNEKLDFHLKEPREQCKIVVLCAGVVYRSIFTGTDLAMVAGVLLFADYFWLAGAAATPRRHIAAEEEIKVKPEAVEGPGVCHCGRESVNDKKANQTVRRRTGGLRIQRWCRTEILAG